jgi:hypothetical protein
LTLALAVANDLIYNDHCEGYDENACHHISGYRVFRPEFPVPSVEEFQQHESEDDGSDNASGDPRLPAMNHRRTVSLVDVPCGKNKLK